MHRVVSGYGQMVFLAVKAVAQVEEDFRLEVGQLQLVDVIPEQMVWRPPGCCGDHW